MLFKTLLPLKSPVLLKLASLKVLELPKALKLPQAQPPLQALPKKCASLAGFLCLLLSLAVPTQAIAQNQPLFPRPPELEPAIQFWIKVYTEVSTDNGYLHDSKNLNIIYERMPRDRTRIDNRRRQIRNDLQVLASGKRDNLTPDQQKILSLWPAGVSNETLSEAASNVRWQLGQSNRFRGGLQRSGLYRAHINQVILEKNLPAELAVLPHVESSFNPNAYSSAAAAGMWQFGRATGRRFMRIDHIVDERMDPYIATNAAMSLLEYNYSVLGTWPLALTAYNHGAGGIARAVRQTGTTDIETIVANYRGRAFGFASRNFYAQFLAVLDIEDNTQKYFGEVSRDAPLNFQTVETDAFIDAEVFAQSLGISLATLQADNPALRAPVWDGNKRIPEGFPVKLRQEAIPDGNLLAMIPADYKFTIQTPDVSYTVERGDSLSVIANRFNTSVSKLVALNQLQSRHRIRIGQRLLLPQDSSANRSIAANALSSDGQYTVRRGDTINLIASHYGVAIQDLLAVNNIVDHNRIYPGQKITLPGFNNQSTTQNANATNPASTSTSTTRTQYPQGVNASGESEPEQLASRTQAPATEPPVREELTPSVAVLSDDQEFDSEVSIEDQQELATEVSIADQEAEALDPEADVAANDAQRTQDLVETLAADPSDYTVASNNTIEIQASETLGHYAEWLGLRAWDLRRLNRMAFRDPVIIGTRLRLDFSNVSIAEFERTRLEFHSTIQSQFFASNRILGVETYRVRRRDNIGRIARQRYSTPIWLLRQYNPELDFNRIQIGQEIIFPLLEQVN